METKKTPKADLESKKGLFLEIGLVFALLIVILAFEWKSYGNDNEVKFERQAVAEVEETVIATQEEAPPPPPDEAPQLETTEFEIVDDNRAIDNEFNVSSFENKGNVTVDLSALNIEAEEEEVQPEAKVFMVVEQDASFPGGEEKRQEFMRKTVKYPQQARETGTKGTVFIGFIVEVDGTLTNFKILRDIGGGCGAEALRAVKLMPKWTPAKQRGKAVRQQFQLPVIFNLEG
ncbi:MAG: energy transducer TonB [Bacteroidales bacterium]|jgi:protein TonB|nr:energy transducer TonB [Bacteroidales bacterium]